MDETVISEGALDSEMNVIDSPFLSRTKRAGLRLNDEGYSYYRERGRADVTYWRCSVKRCKGRIVQKSNGILRTKHHTHPPPIDVAGHSETFVAALSIQPQAFETKTTMPATDPALDVNGNCDDPSVPREDGTMSPGSDLQTAVIVWENDEEELMDIKPNMEELERSIAGFTRDMGMNTEPDALIIENTMLKMKIQKLETDLRRYKDTFRRIKADLDTLTGTPAD